MKKMIQTLFAASLFFTACENKPAPAAATATVAEPIKPTVSYDAPSTKCYELRFKTDLTAIELTTIEDRVEGFYAYEPTQKDAGLGSFKGKSVGNDTYKVIYTYMMEGSVQSEEMVFKKEGDKLLKGEGELIDPKNDGNLTFKDITKLTFKEAFTPTDCAKIAPSISRAKAMVASILVQKESSAVALMVGEWTSKDDPKASIKLKDGKFWFINAGQKPEPALKYAYFPTCPKDCNPIAEMPCLKVTGQDNVCYAVIKADGKVLELSQIGGTGNTNRYVRKK